ncbi:MAG: hypothetical protein JSV08_07685 [Acidobacteriota bacterium]|nr:MAG: hypothetical protein JSV08_07685 [Acidobacteriota bacterium]
MTDTRAETQAGTPGQSENTAQNDAQFRKKFLLIMYQELWNNINRHILVVWQSVGVVVGAIAIFSLVERHVLTEEIASILLILLCAWLFGHAIDANLWFNRNIAIVINIEREFLKREDLKDILPFFKKHPKKRASLMHFRLQGFLAAGIAGIALIYHFVTCEAPAIEGRMMLELFLWCLPLIIFFLCVGGLCALYYTRVKKFEEQLNESPGLDIEALNNKAKEAQR